MAQQKSSKFRHIFGDNPKPEACYQGFQNVLASGEGSYVAANHKFFSVAKASGGGPVYITRLDSPGRVSPSAATLSVHRGKVWDMDFHPFLDSMIATASDDCRCNVTLFPEEGLEDNITEPTVELEGHSKKVILCQFNPSANNVLSSAGFDRTVKVWNITKSACVNSFEDFGDTIYSLEWNGDGSMVGCTSKDKCLRFYDPRAGNDAVQCIADVFEGGKSSKVFWVPNLNLIGATGFNRQSKQELKLFSLDNLAEPWAEMNFGVNSSVNYPFYDSDLSILYLYGKGNTLIHYIEVTNSSRPLYQLNTYRATGPQKGGCWVPKRGLDVMKCEVQRFMKLTAKDVLPISFIVPRKAGADIFQDDIFPDCASGVAALEADAWEEGVNAEPNRMSMDPAQRENMPSSGQSATFVAKKSYNELERENEELRARIAELEAQLAG